MKRGSKIILFTVGGIIVLGVAVLLLRNGWMGGLTSRIPELANLQGLSQPVREQISEAVNKAKRNPSSDNLGTLAMVYHSSANYEQAAQCYQLAIQRSASEWTWDYYFGCLNIEMGESVAVIENFKRVIEKNPKADLAWYYIGEAYRNQRKNELAEESFNKIAAPKGSVVSTGASTRIDHFPLNAYARFQLSRIYVESGRSELAEKTLREILQANRTFGPAYRLLGNIYSERGDTVLGERYGDRANDLVVFLPPVDTLVDRLVLISRSEFYLLKKIDEAERTFYDQWTLRLVDQALTYMPDNKYLISKAINIFLWMGLDDRATSYIDRHISYFQDNFTELNKTGLVFFMNRLYPQARKYLTSALELEPDHIEIREELAMCYWSVNERDKAYDMLDGLMEQHPGNADVLADAADILFFNFGDMQRATVALSRLKRLSPEHPKGLKVSAGIAEQNGRDLEAISLYEAAFRGYPEELTTIRYLGNLLVKQRMWERAIGHFREALEYHPNDPELLEKLGSLLTMCPDPAYRKMREGIEYLERAFIHMSSRPSTLISAGRSLSITLAQLGDKRNALRTIEHTLEIGRYENISPAYQAELEEIYRTILALSD
jgi:tetratricopeptide (TPR) repeat protein